MKTYEFENYLMEVENHHTGSYGVIVAPSKKDMHEKLLQKGFTYDKEVEKYIGFNKAGEEISVRDLVPNHVDDLKRVYKS